VDRADADAAASVARARGGNGFISITFHSGDHQSRPVVSSRQLRPRSTISSEARVKAMTPTAAKVSPRWLQ